MASGKFISAAMAVAMEIGAHDFGLRERLVLELVLKRSFLVGELDAYIPMDAGRKWKFFATATRISEGNVPAIVNGLARKNVIEQPVEGFWGFILPSANWRVARRAEEAEVLRQLELLERPPCLRSAMRAVFVEGGLPGQGTMITPGAVPLMSGAQPNSGCASAFGNGDPNRVARASAQKIKELERQPESGDAHVHVHDHVTEISMVHDHAGDRNRVGERRTGRLFEVGASGMKSAEEIMEVVRRHIQPLPKFLRDWHRRIYEDAGLVWELAMECRELRIPNKAGWANRGYMRQKGLGRWASK